MQSANVIWQHLCDKYPGKNNILNMRSLGRALNILAHASCDRARKEIEAIIRGLGPGCSGKLGMGGSVEAVNLFYDLPLVLNDNFRNWCHIEGRCPTIAVPMTYKATAALSMSNLIEAQTCDRVRRAVLPSDIGDSVIIIVDAFHFHDKWFHQMLATGPGQFGSDQTAEYMFLIATLYYAEDANWRVVSLPYRNTEASMLIALPKTKDSIWLDPETVQGLVAQMRMASVRLTMPQFSFKQRNCLTEALTSCSASMFEPGNLPDLLQSADFPLRALGASRVIQVNEIDVDVKGTTAESVTQIAISGCSGMAMSLPQPIIFDVDEPFHFALVRNPHDVILAGSVFDPVCSWSASES